MNEPIEAKPRKRPAIENRNAMSHLLRETIRRWTESTPDTPGLSISEIALVADVDHKLLTRFLKGERGLTMISVDRLAVAFGLTINDKSTPAGRFASAVKAKARKTRAAKEESRGRKAKGKEA